MWVKSSWFDTPWTSFLSPHSPTLPRFLPFPLSWPNKDGLSTHEEKKFIHLVYSIIEVEFSSNVGQISFSFNILSSPFFFPPFPLLTPPPTLPLFPFLFWILPFFPPPYTPYPCAHHMKNSHHKSHQSFGPIVSKTSKRAPKKPPFQKKKKKEKKKRNSRDTQDPRGLHLNTFS